MLTWLLVIFRKTNLGINILLLWFLGLLIPTYSMEYRECPEFQKQVKTKQLLPVQERLPEEPLVVTVKEIGQYGGVWRQAHLGVTDIADCHRIIREPLINYAPNFTDFKPNVAKEWKWNKNATQLIIYLRKGMRWSDGEPFTADDLMFWYEDIVLNKELNPIIPNWLKINGQVGKLEKIDTYTVRWTFAKPYGFFIEQLASVWNLPYAAKHYLKQFHPRYTPLEKIKPVIEQEGFDTWIALFQAKNGQFNNPDLPGIEAWIAKTKVDEPVHRFERNPFYWKIDQAGDQLPYLDRIKRYLVPSEDAVLLRALSGEIEVQQRRLCTMANYPLLMEHRKQGDYRLQLYPTPETNEGTIYINYHTADPFLHKLFWDKRFRIALSLAINREEINQLLFKGLYIPSQSFPGKGTPWYVEQYSQLFINYYPKEANHLLDEIGLTKKDSEGYRLRPDGKRLTIINDVFSTWPLNMEIQDLIKEYWQEIGIQMLPRPVARELWVTRVTGAQFELASYIGYAGSLGADPVVQVLVYPFASTSYWGPLWGLWFSSDGKAGEEPPRAVKQLMVLRDKAMGEPNPQKRIDLNKEAMKIRAENLWEIGILSSPLNSIARFIVIKNYMRNIPPTGLYDGNWTYYHPASWFISK
jgi:peptide/nickel transport system substrate-binding protein